MTALTLAREGQDVLLLDVKKEIPKVSRCCCTALITEPITHGDTVTIQDNNIHFEKNDFTVRYTGEWVKLEKSIRLSPGEKKLTMANDQGVAWPYSYRGEVHYEMGQYELAVADYTGADTFGASAIDGLEKINKIFEEA